MSLDLVALLAQAVEAGASDLHLVTGSPPAWRLHGRIDVLPRAPLDEAEIRAGVEAILSPERQAEFQRHRRLCFTLHRPGLGLFRVNLYSHLGRMEAAIRIAREHLPDLATLGVPEGLAELMRLPQGLILVTGPTGQGKTTTLHALLARVHGEQRRKIITIEDPVEFLHPPGRSILVQQEIGLDAQDFHGAVVHALRQDPDILCIGEMRDLETISAALTAAETGHLVVATLHTTGAAGTISRIVDVFPPHQQEQIRVQLALVLQAVICQRLLPRADGNGRVLVYEYLVATEGIRTMIRGNKVHQILSAIQTGGTLGMRTLDAMIRSAWLAGEITWDTATGAVLDPRVLRSTGPAVPDVEPGR